MSNPEVSGFIAYPSSPREISESLLAARSGLLRRHPSWVLDSWENNDIAGRCLIDPVLEKIRERNILIADVTRLNFNVTYEIGYALGLQKSVFLVRNKSVNADDKLIIEVGIFDTLGYVTYANSEELIEHLKSIRSHAPLPLSQTKLNKRSPVYIVTPREKAEAEIRIISRLKKAGGISFRSFDPVESGRLSVRSAIDNVCQSIGVVLPLLASNRSDAISHNLRCAFVAGLAHALEKETLLLQAASSDPVPLDLRDYVSTFDTLESINRIVAKFAPRIMERLQEEDEFVMPESRNPLSDLSLGQSAAENEITQLGVYYLQTEEFNRVINGDVSVVAGRKGSGKSALFFQTRNKLRKDKRHIVLDLNPEGFQLKKFKDLVLRHLEQGTREHTITAFWEYLFLLEICYKLLEKDRHTYMHDHLIRDHYLKASALYENERFVAEGDFAERMLKLTENIEDAFQTAVQSNSPSQFLARSQITELLYKHDLKELRATTLSYLALKRGLWILFDNIDKGWHAHGIEDADLLILRCLLEALSKLRRELQRAEIPCNTVVFLRNDVYELLIGSMPDRGKISKIALDWTDEALLKEVLRLRFVSNVEKKEASFEAIWRTIAESHIFGGQESSSYVLQRCLMRPRALIDFLSQAKGHAVNLRHNKITEEDFKIGEQAYSTDLINQIDLEIQDVYPEVKHSLYAFIEAPNLLVLSKLREYIGQLGLEQVVHDRVVEILLWYGFLGVQREDGTIAYIYDVNYEIRKLTALARKRSEDDLVYAINPAFWAGLEVKEIKG